MNAIYMVFEIVSTLIECSCCFGFLSVFFNSDVDNKERKCAILAVIMSIFVFIFNSITLFSMFTIFFLIVFVTVSLKVVFKEDLLKSFSLVGFYFLYLNIVDFMCLTIMANILRDPEFAYNVSQGFSGERCILILNAKTILIMSVLILKKKAGMIKMESRQLLGGVVLGFFGIVYLIDLSLKSVDVALSLNWILLFGLLVGSLFFIVTISKYRLEKNRMSIVQLNNEIAQKKYTEILNTYENRQRIYHDVDNHMIVLLGMLKDKEYDAATEYVQKTSAEIFHINDLIWTSDKVIDFILNCKKEEAEGYDIEFSINADSINCGFIESTDLCLIIGNTLDNAIEACQQMIKKQDKYINVTIRHIQDMLVLRVENSLAILPKEVNGQLKSQKDSSSLHGFGIKNIKNMVEKYDGEFQYQYNKEKFSVYITFFHCT